LEESWLCNRLSSHSKTGIPSNYGIPNNLYFFDFEGSRSEKRPFGPSMMVYFRKRLDAETLKALDLRIFERRRKAAERPGTVMLNITKVYIMPEA